MAGFLLGFMSACTWQPIQSPLAPLADLKAMDPTLALDIRYATTQNFTGKVLYPEARALLLQAPARALIKAHQALAAQGLGIVIYDAYRPFSVTQTLWQEATPEQRRQGFVADPSSGSMHNRGCAVDVGLFERSNGKRLEMPSAFDEFSQRAHTGYTGGDPTAQAHSRLLQDVMHLVGFEVLPQEWWHFNFKGCEDQPILDLDFRALRLSPEPV